MDTRRKDFEARVLVHLDAGLRLAKALVGSTAQAEDVVQDSVLRAYRGFDALRGEDARPWFLAIVRNVGLSTLARGARRPLQALPEGDCDAEWLTDPAPGPEAAYMADQASDALAVALAALAPAYREILLLREVEELDYRAIAQVVGVKIGTVMSRLARARAALRVQWHAINEERHRDL